MYYILWLFLHLLNLVFCINPKHGSLGKVCWNRTVSLVSLIMGSSCKNDGCFWLQWCKSHFWHETGICFPHRPGTKFYRICNIMQVPVSNWYDSVFNPNIVKLNLKLLNPLFKCFKLAHGFQGPWFRWNHYFCWEWLDNIFTRATKYQLKQ